MCRILGVASPHSLSVSDLSCFENASRTLRHGGPDDSGTYVSPRQQVAFGHRRLSIIDLSPLGHQPMISTDGQLVLVFNGEIYNYQQIKDRLVQKGHRFKSTSDTEVILYAYHEWGTDAFAMFNGMYAFALYDLRQDKILLVRDYAGIKPLYYACRQDKLYFASEVKAFKQFDPQWPEDAVWKPLFFSFGFVPAPYTTLQQVKPLPKGHYLEWSLKDGSSQLRSFLSFTYTHEIKDEQTAVQEMREVMKRAVERHLIADAPLGVFLSGGIDSSLLTLLTDQIGHRSLHTLSINFKEATFSEDIYQQMVLSKVKAEHASYIVGEEMFLEHFEDIFDAMDQPSYDGINTYFVSKCAQKHGIKAVLSGLGADEFFGGYPSFFSVNKLRYVHRLPSLVSSVANMLPSTNPYKKLNFAQLDNQSGDYLMLRGVYTPQIVAELCGMKADDVLHLLGKTNLLTQPRGDDANYASTLETNYYMENQLLKDSDYMSMWHALEIRVPFLDLELIQLVHRIDPAVKFKQHQPKFLITEAFKDLLPYEIVHRRKQGFVFPFQLWLSRNEKLLKNLLPDHPTYNKLWNKMSTSNLHWSRFWALVVAQKFKYH